MGASRNRLSPPRSFSLRESSSLLWILELRYTFGTTIQIGCTAAQLPSVPVSQLLLAKPVHYDL